MKGASTESRKNNNAIFNKLSLASVPAMNNRESPGKNGVITKPVSQKIIRNKIG